MKKVIVIRLGAFGDMVQITPLLRKLKQDDYHVTLYSNARGNKVLKYDPNVDKFITHDESIKDADLDGLFAKFNETYDRVLNLSGSIENALLVTEGTEEFNKPKEYLDKECNINYVEQILGLCNYPMEYEQTNLYFSPLEHSLARKFRKKHKNQFLIMWSISGSAFHKSYPHMETVARAFLDSHPDAFIFTVGDGICGLLEWDHPRTQHYNGIWDIRTSFIMTKYSDLVVGPETGVLNAAGCYDTPKIIFMSHSSEENLTKGWKNVYPLSAMVPCQPCHKLNYTLRVCPIEPGINAPLCMAKIPPATVLNTMEDIYEKWREKNGIDRSRIRISQNGPHGKLNAYQHSGISV